MALEECGLSCIFVDGGLNMVYFHDLETWYIFPMLVPEIISLQVVFSFLFRFSSQLTSPEKKKKHPFFHQQIP